MEDLGLRAFWSGKKVLVTGHTGFKGSWLSFILTEWGAEVVGLGLEPDQSPSLFEQLELQHRVEYNLFDIAERDRVLALVGSCEPDIVFHLAAQPLVRYSYAEPLSTWKTNVLGTVHLLEALRSLTKPCAAIAFSILDFSTAQEYIFQKSSSAV